MKRRDFINWVGLGVLAGSLPVAIAACQSEDTASTPTPDSAATPEVDSTPRDDGFATIGTVTELDGQGFLASKTFQGEQVIVVRNAGDVIALNSLCTHQGCSVDWDGDAEALACPCHGSKFSPDGTVTEGPAASPLGVFEAKIEEDWVLVKVG
ncbi:MAG: ubiquinol-cytochrome c reductase iron-sulfur subunit [Cyanobacteria bacterium J06638_28]